VWDGRIVSDSALTTRINAARRVLGDSGDKQRLIRTVARKGIRFVAEVRQAQEGAAHAIAPTLRPVPDSLVRSVFRNREHSERYMEGLHAATQAA
jgi:DNA-binding winged helix-turn-helix (wHTH) protein